MLNETLTLSYCIYVYECVNYIFYRFKIGKCTALSKSQTTPTILNIFFKKFGFPESVGNSKSLDFKISGKMRTKNATTFLRAGRSKSMIVTRPTLRIHWFGRSDNLTVLNCKIPLMVKDRD